MNPSNCLILEAMVVVQALSHILLFATPPTVARQAPLSVGFSRQEHWSGLPCPPLGDLPQPGLNALSKPPKWNQVCLT